MPTLNSGAFSVIVNRDTSSSMISNNFTITVNRPTSSPSLGETVVKVSKRGVALVGTNNTSPSDGYFCFTIIKTDGCRATKSGVDSLRIDSIEEDVGTVTLNINAENKSNYTKVITVLKANQGVVGEDGYTVILTNEAHTFLGDETKALESSTNCGVIVYKGSTRVSATIGTPTGMPDGMTITVNNNSTINASVTIAVTSSMTRTSGEVTIPITVNNRTFNKVFTYSLALRGADGSDAKFLGLSADRQVVAFDSSGKAKDSTAITLTATQQNFNDAITWTTSPSVTLTGSGKTRKIATSSFDSNNYIKVTITSGTLSDSVTLVKVVDGANGMDGVPGDPGENGITYYTWIRYADDENGTNISNSPIGKNYIGLAYNKTTSVESNDPSDYNWFKVVGEKGDTGEPGEPGADGTTYYTWIKYSDYADGTDLYDIPNDGTKYIGIAVNRLTASESNNKADYVWSKFKGEDGRDGTSITILGSYDSEEALNNAHPDNNTMGDSYIVNGDLYVWTGEAFNNVGDIKGEDGRTSYFHVKYSNDGGLTFTSNNGEDVGLYMGTYVNFIESDSNNVDDYTWVLIKGEQGINGADGVDGKDGTSIVWKGTFDKHPNNPEDGWAYKNSTDKKSYVYQDGAWYQMTIDGTDGIDGNDGKDGLSIEYKGELTSPPSNPIKNWCYKDTNNGTVYIYTGTAWEVLTYDGSDGIDGANGADGLSVFITYHDSETKPNAPTESGTTNGWHTDCTESVVWMSQKISDSATTGTWGEPIKIRGIDGKDGVNGADGVDGQDGVSILWQGTFATHPSNPQNGWAYKNSTDGKSYTYRDNTWYQMTVDGIDGNDGRDGTDGLSIDYRGEMSSAPSNPIRNWVYRDSDNGIVYIYTGTAWEVMTYDGTDGADGINGTNGVDGTDGLSVFITYHDNLTKPSTPIGNGTSNGWHTNCTDAVVWMSQKVAMTSTEGTWGTPVKIKGQDGKDGTSVTILGTYNSLDELNAAHGSGNTNGDGYIIQGDLYVWDGTQFLNVGKIKGEDGINGVSSYLHIKYSNDGGRTFTSNDGEDVGDYMGVYTDSTISDSMNPADYKWTKIKGEQGIQGEQGVPGNDGQTTYFHIKYSANANGNPMTETPSTYIGTYVDYTQADSNDYTKYTWSRFQGLQGEQGLPGTNGENGQTYYLHIKYSNDGGNTFTSNNGEDAGTYIGVYTDTTQADSTSVSKYTWSKIKGEDGAKGDKGDKGEQGIQGVPGNDGRTTYFHIKYSNNANGNPMTETPSTYIGTYVDYTEADSTDYTKYTWSRFQGLQGERGEQGIPGTNGTDGQTYYLHIKYSNDGGKTFTSNNGEDTGTYIGVYTDTNVNDSNSVSSYTWSKIKGEDGTDGKDGEKGQSLVSSVPQWYLSTSNTTQTGGSWVETMPKLTSGKYLWLRYKLTWENPSSITYTTPTLEQVAESMKDVVSKQSQLEQTVEGFKTTVSETYATKNALNDVDKKFDDYSTTTSMNSAINQKSNEILSTVNETYATKTALNNVDGKFTNYSTTKSMNSAIDQKANEITSTVSSTYATKNELTGQITNVNTKITSVEQTAEKIGWIVQGESSSSMTMTDEMLAIITKQVKITGNMIVDGTITASDISSNAITSDKINANAVTTEKLSASAVTADKISSNAITTDKLNANAVTVDKISSNAITSDKINAGAITADKIAAGSINADKIAGKELVGVTLRNADSTFTVDGNGNITGASITSSVGDNWQIDQSGNMEVKDLSVEGTLTCKGIAIEDIQSPKYPSTLDADIKLYVSNLTGSDDYSLDEILQSYDESEEQGSVDIIKKFYSLKGLEAALPRNLNGKTVRIYCETDDNGQILFRNFTSGRILIFLCSHEVKGYIGDYNCYADFKIYGGSDQNKPTTYGKIRPSTNTVYSSNNSSVFLQKSPSCGIYYCDIYGGSSASGYSALKVTEACICRIDNCNFYSAYTFVNASSLAQVYCNTTSGMATEYAFKSYTGSIVHLSNTKQANGTKGNAYWSNGSVIFGSLSQTIVGNYKITWDSSTPVENNTTTGATTTATATYKSNYGDTYRSTVYNSWKKDNTCRQGDYGYGDCTGVWFFGTQFSELKGKTIKSVKITITRQSGGSSSAVTHKLWMHNYSSRPSGAPTLNSAWSQTFTLATGNSTTITITNSAVLNAIKAGTCKGFAIRHTYSSGYYSVCSGSATVKITYEE